MKSVMYLRDIEGVEQILCVDIDEDVLRRNKEAAEPLLVDFLNPRMKPLTVEVCEGCVTQNDKKLENTDAVICIELIEHLFPSTLENVPDNIFGYIRPKLVIITTPNADFNVAFKSLVKYRHPDHKFEWTRKEFQDWALAIVNKYSCYEVTFTGVGVLDRRNKYSNSDIGMCTQIAIFKRIANVGEETLKREGIVGFNTMFKNDFPCHTQSSLRKKILEEAQYYINSIQKNDESQPVYLQALIYIMSKKFSPTLQELEEILVEEGWKIENRETGPAAIKKIINNVDESSSSNIDTNFSVHDKENSADGSDCYCSDITENEWNFNGSDSSEDMEHDCTSEGIPDYNEGWNEEQSIVIPQNCSIVQENTYLFDGENVTEENCDNDKHSSSSDTKEYTLPIKQEFTSNSLPIILNETETDSVCQTVDSNVILVSNERSPLCSSLRNTAENLDWIDNTTNENSSQSALTEDANIDFRAVQRDSNLASSPQPYFSHMSVSRSSTSPGFIVPDEFLHDHSINDEDELYNSQHLLNSTFKEPQTNKTEMNIENFSTDAVSTEELALEDDSTQNETNFLDHLMQNNDTKHAEKQDTVDSEIVVRVIQKVDPVLLLDDEMKYKEENVYCTLTTASKTSNTEAETHIEVAINDITQSNKKNKSSSSPRELLCYESPHNGFLTSSECAKETDILDDSFQSCEDNETTDNTIVEFTSVLKSDDYNECDIENPINKDITYISNAFSSTSYVEANPSCSTFETPPDSLSHEIIDSGYPNSASVQDITPENDLSSIAQDHIPEIESPSAVEAPRFDILEPIEVVNGDLANNNRDDEGNNMIAADVNDIEERLQPFIDVLENDLENENDIYVVENDFPMWLLRILDMANPLDFDMQPQQMQRVRNQVEDDANYMGYDEGFDGSSDNDSDITNNEIMNNECDDYEI